MQKAYKATILLEEKNIMKLCIFQPIQIFHTIAQSSRNNSKKALCAIVKAHTSNTFQYELTRTICSGTLSWYNQRMVERTTLQRMYKYQEYTIKNICNRNSFQTQTRSRRTKLK